MDGDVPYFLRVGFAVERPLPQVTGVIKVLWERWFHRDFWVFL